MKSNNKTGKLVAILLLLTMIALVLLSGTYAKYTTSASGTDTATVAKWAIELNGSPLEDKVSFDLFGASGVYELKDVTDFTANGVVDEDVVKTGKKVAPGTWGKVDFEVTNKSDVRAEFSINLTQLNTTLPLKFSVDGSEWTKASEITATELAPYKLGGQTLEIGSTTEQKSTVSLYWKWDFEDGTDVDDTALGSAGTATCTVAAKIICDQVD